MLVPRLPIFPLMPLLSLAAAVPLVTQGVSDDQLATLTQPFTAKEISQGYSDRKILVLPHAGTDTAAMATMEAAAGFGLERVFTHVDNVRVLLLPGGMTTAEARSQLAATGMYEIIEPDYLVETAVTPSDPAFTDGSQWHHRNFGQDRGTVGADIGSEAAWDLRTDASSIIVAVIDSGTRLTHQDIGPNLWTNAGEVAGNNLDDDNNGYVDDVHGINAIDNDGDPSPGDNGNHGTHVAGIVGAAANNGVAGTGVAWRVQLMPLRFLGRDEDGRGAISDGVECIDYAIAKGADVMNASYGSTTFSRIEFQAIRRARDAGIILVAAAGNGSQDLDVSRFYPASHLIDNIVTVANSTRLDDLSSTSNTGSGAVDLAAPGSQILSLGTMNDTATLVASGTSMATPMVAGAVALLRAHYPGEPYQETINRLLRGARQVAAFSGEVQTGGRLHVADALTGTDTRPFNDDFADRAMLAGPIVTVRGSSWNATAETGEPAHAGQLTRSLWYSWTAPTDGLVQIDTRDSIGDTTLAVYTGETLAGLSLVTANDNESAGFLSSRVSFEATAGTTFQVAFNNSRAGLAVINLAAAAANDAFASAQPIAGDAPLITTINSEATSEPGEPLHFNGANQRSLWYQWTAPADQIVQVSAHSSAADPVMAVYVGDAIATLTLVGNSDDTGIDAGNLNAMVEFTATEDQTYYIALDTIGGSEGEITLTLTNALWQFATGDIEDDPLSPDYRRPRITNVPTVGPDGVIYVGSSDNNFYAINPDGSLRWRSLLRGFADSSAATLGVDGTIYFGTIDLPRIYALNPDGSTRWSVDIGTGGFGAPLALAADGTIYAKQSEGILRSFSAEGTERWNYPVIGGSGSYAGPAVAADGTIYYPANDGALHALSPAGELRWIHRPLREDGTNDISEIFTSPAIDRDGNIYLSTLNGTVNSITAGGDLRWTFRTPEPGENVSSSLAVGEGRVHFASYGGFLYALDQTNGRQVWRSSIEAQARASSPAIAADGSVVVGSYANKLFRFSREGALIRSWSAGNWFRSSPVIAHGRMYVGNGDGKIYAFPLDDLGPAYGEDYPWPQYRHGPRHLGRTTIESSFQVRAASADDPGRLINLSVRNRTERGSGNLTAGFVLDGPGDKELVVRGIGPTLADFAVFDPIEATELRVFQSGNSIDPIESSRGWNAGTGDGRELGAFPLPLGSNDSVVRRFFAAGSFTAQVLPATNVTEPGVALVEIYDGDIADLGTRLVNLSARTNIAANDTVTAGFVIAGQSPRTVLIRAVGPGLAEFGVTDTLADPRIMLLNGPVAEFGNDNWNGYEAVRAAAEAVGAFPLLNDSNDAALLTSLPPGTFYTAQVGAPAGQGGVVLIEVYLLAED